MLKPKRKITRKEIKQDKLVEAYANITKMYYENKKYVSYAVTGLVVIVIAVLIYVNNRQQSNEKAASELGKIFSVYDAASNNPAQYRQAIDGQPDRGVMGLKKIVDNYGSSESGQLARLYLGNAYYALGKYDEALEQFDSFGGGNPLLKASALAGVGACLEAKGEFDKAAAKYEKAAATASDDISAPEYLNDAAYAYGRAGDKERAISLYKRLKKDYPSSQYARDVDRYISEFSV